MIQVLTPTGARPEAFALCQAYMRRQTYAGAVQWIIVDDGPDPQLVWPMPSNWSVQIIRPDPPWQPGQNTQARNLLAGLAYIDDDAPLAIIEDDDWYAPDYLAGADAQLAIERVDLVGVRRCRKYNIRLRRARELDHPRQASLCASVMRREATRRFRQLVAEEHRLVDTVLWAQPQIARALYAGAPVVGMKGLPGRAGIDSGHRPDFGEIADPSGQLLYQWIGEDARSYLR